MKSRKINKSRLALAITAGTLGALAQQAVAAGFIEDSKASLTLRNFYINTDNRNGTASPSKQEEWGQGFILNYQSGFTQGTVGFGVDALGLLGVRLDGGGRAGKSGLDRQPGTVFPLESNGEPVHDFASLGLTAKAKVSNTEFRYGTLQPKLPVVTYNDGRLLPVTFEGGQVTSTDLKDFTLVAGQLEHSKGRNSTDNRSLSIAGANGSSASSRDSNKFYYAGGDYKVNKDLTLQYYYGNLDDFYKQHSRPDPQLADWPGRPEDRPARLRQQLRRQERQPFRPCRRLRQQRLLRQRRDQGRSRQPRLQRPLHLYRQRPQHRRRLPDPQRRQ